MVLLDPSTRRSNTVYQKVYDTRRVLHVWRILKVIIECDFKLFMQHVMEKSVSKDILALNDAQVLAKETASQETKGGSSDFIEIPVYNYLDLLVVTALRYISSVVHVYAHP